MERYGKECGWVGLSRDEMAADWKTAKSSVMLRLCHDLSCGEFPDFTMPQHIQAVLDFMKDKDLDKDGGQDK